MTIQAMEYFVKVAECASFTRASASLFVSQPTLSRQIMNLELELGAVLIDRSIKKTVRLTAEGEAFLEEARKILRQIKQLPSVIHNVGEKKLSVSIGYHSSFNNRFFHQAVFDFSSRYPNIRLNLKCCDSNSLNRGIQDGSFDIIFIAEFCMDALPGTIKTALGESELCAAVAADHKLAGESGIALEALRDESFVFIDRALSPVSLDWMLSLCRASGFSPNVVEWFQDKPTLLVAVGANVGISLTLSGAEIPHTVRLIPLSDPCVRSSYYAVYCSANRNPATRPFISILEQNIAALGRE